jgi:DNA topoisomerase IA
MQEILLGERLGEKYLTNAPRIYSSTENAQEAHEAIRPTNAYMTADDLMNQTEEEKRLYQLIWQQYIAAKCQMQNIYQLQQKSIFLIILFLPKVERLFLMVYKNISIS